MRLLAKIILSPDSKAAFGQNPEIKIFYYFEQISEYNETLKGEILTAPIISTPYKIPLVVRNIIATVFSPETHRKKESEIDPKP